MSLLPILDIVGKVIDKVIPDPTAKAQLTLQLAQLADQEAARDAQNALQQIELNKIEAQHSNLFVAGWRPFIGWGCGAALLYNTLLAPMTGLGVADLGFLQTVLLALLGLGGMRSYEKVNGAATGAVPAKVTPVATPEPVKKKKKDIWPW